MSAPSAGALTLCDGSAEVEILPGRGAAIARYELVGAFGRAPVFAPTPFGSGQDAMTVASILLAPWSNRISNGGFQFRGRFVALSPNLPDEAFPIHGNAFQMPWRLMGHSPTSATLCLDSEGPGAFRYRAQVGYSLLHGALTVSLTICNTGHVEMPFGLGLHPWLPRTPRTELAFEATGVWLEDKDHLPVEWVQIARAPQWDFSAARRLPGGWINNAFETWDGRAGVRWPDRGLELEIVASERLKACIVYSPGKDADFFCFEPVSHPVDAHNLAPSEDRGLAVLAHGETFDAWCRFHPKRVVRP